MVKRGNRIRLRIYIGISGELSSPLLIGSGKEEQTDMDVLMTHDKVPYIPGSALAGVLRNYIENHMGGQEADNLFGTSGWGISLDNREQPEGIEYQSRILVYDTLLYNAYVTRRDGVRLDEYKTSEERKKYDMQVVEDGARFLIRLEIIVREHQVEALGGLDKAIQHDLRQVEFFINGIAKGNLRLGARSSRGFGRLKDHEAGYWIFQMDNREDFLTWLHWDSNSVLDSGTKFDLEKTAIDTKDSMHCLVIPLKIKNTILVRQYNAWAWGGTQGDGNFQTADYGQITLYDGNAVIPGSTWSGAIRSYVASRVNEFLGFSGWQRAQEALDCFFGTWSQDTSIKDRRASRVIFEETKIKGGHGQPAARNAIDRFTGGTGEGKLYKEIFWVKGSVDLEIRWSDYGFNEMEQKILCGLLLWAVYGLWNGLLSVGGETGVGRGIFEPAGAVCLDSHEIRHPQPYLRAAVEWCRGLKSGYEEEGA